MTFWCFMLGVPLLAYGLLSLVCPTRVAAGQVAFPRNKLAGWILCAAGWAFTAYEVDTIGIDVFDRIVQRLWFLPSAIPGAVWIWMVVLTVLTCWWMPNLLPLRGVSAIFMLFPAELFPCVRLCDTSWRLVLVVFAYLCAIAGMYGMFYPWRIRQLLAWQSERPSRVRLPGLLWTVWGATCVVLGVCSAAGLVR